MVIYNVKFVVFAVVSKNPPFLIAMQVCDVPKIWDDDKFKKKGIEIRSDPSYEQRLDWRKLQSAMIRHSKIDVLGIGMLIRDN